MIDLPKRHLIGNGDRQVFVPTLKLTAMSQAITPENRDFAYLLGDFLAVRLRPSRFGFSFSSALISRALSMEG
jgi:hypothetical protein